MISNMNTSLSSTIKHPSLFPEPQNSIQSYSNNITEKSFDDLSKSTYTNYGNYPPVESNRNFKVMVRVRPPLPRELESSYFLSTVKVSLDNKRVSVYEYFNIDSVDPAQLTEYAETTNMFTLHAFTFDYVFDQDSTQVQVYETTAKPAVMSVLQGYNATILAYGQTGTGKTFTMEGFKYTNQDPQRGMVPRSMEEIFRYIENGSNAKTTFMVRASYLQIYNEVISDLLRTERTNLHIREDKKKGVFVEGLSEWAVRSPSDIYNLIQKGALARATASTKMNDVSSRSHAVFIIIVEQMINHDEDSEYGKEIRVGKLNLVDLAGSERVRVTGATGKRLEESKKINQSLSALGNVISALTDFKHLRSHIPYRDSKITRLLEDSLGGNCITTMMAMVSPVIEAFGETLSSLKFANRAKNIKNDPIINEDVDQKALLRKYEAELRRLRVELEDRNKFLLDNTSVLQLEEDKRKAERDKVAAVVALEMRSQEFNQEREEKKKLEEKIKTMYSQVLQGGKKIEDTPQFRNAIEEHQKVIRLQYEKRLQDLEKERQMIEEDKAQVDKYKQLLLKQRDIMIALTTRLNERDETIVQLQEELDAYDRIHRETEDFLEANGNRVSMLESILTQNGINFPEDTRPINMIERPNGQGFPRSNNELYPEYPTEVIRYDDEDNDNTTEQNLLTAEEKITELTQIADDRKQEIGKLKEQINQISNSQDVNEYMKQELEELREKAKQAQKEQNSLKQLLHKKQSEIARLKQQDNSPMLESLTNFYQEIKYSIDNIIDSLSSQNEPHKLQDVARELLGLQKLVSSISLGNEDGRSNHALQTYPDTPSVTEQTEHSERRMSSTRPIKHSASQSRLDQEQPPAPNFNFSIPDAKRMSKGNSPNEQFAYNRPQDSYENARVDSLSQGDGDRKPVGRSPVMNQRVKGGSIEEQKVPIKQKQGESNGGYSNVTENVKNVNPTRKPMTVEEMLQLKKKEAAQKNK